MKNKILNKVLNNTNAGIIAFISFIVCLLFLFVHFTLLIGFAISAGDLVWLDPVSQAGLTMLQSIIIKSLQAEYYLFCVSAITFVLIAAWQSDQKIEIKKILKRERIDIIR